MEPEAEVSVDAVFRALAEHVAERKVKLLDVFYRVDTDGSRGMDRYEWAEALELMQVQLTAAEAEAVFGSLDADQSGSIDIDEFFGRMKTELDRLKEEKQLEEERVAKIQARIRGRQQRMRFASAAKLVVGARRAAGVSQLTQPTICPRCGEVSKFDLQARLHARKCEEQASLARREEERAKQRGEWKLQLYVEVLEGVGVRTATHAAKEAAAQPPGDDPVQSAQLQVELESTGLVLEIPAWPARQTGFAVGEIVKAPVEPDGGRLQLCKVLGNSKSATSLTLCRVAAPPPPSPRSASSEVGEELEVQSISSAWLLAPVASLLQIAASVTDLGRWCWSRSTFPKFGRAKQMWTKTVSLSG